MLHEISSDDDDLPEIGSILNRQAKANVFNRQTSAIVVSDNDSSNDAPSGMLGIPLASRINSDMAMARRVIGSHKDQYSSESYSESVVPLDDEQSSVQTAGFAGILTGHGDGGLSSKISTSIVSKESSEISQPIEPSPAKRKKRSPEEIADAKRLAEMKKRQREEEKEKKKQEKEAKAKTKEFEAAKKRHLQQMNRIYSKEDSLKYLTIMVDPELVKKTCGARIIGMATEREQRYEVQSQPHPNLISFWREVPEAKELPGLQLEVVMKEVVEDQLLLWLSAAEFMEFVQVQCQEKCGAMVGGLLSLRAFIKSLQRKLEDRKITLLVQGLQKYLKEQTAAKARSKGKNTQQFVSRLDVEETLVDIQFTTGCNVCFTQTDEETARHVLHYAKAVAQTPYKRNQKCTGLNIYIDKSSSVKMGTDGSGITAAWRQIIQIFKGIGADTANAIMAEFPTPRSLYEAYQTCSTEKEAIRLLENIMVRRGEGVMETSRRVGKELAKKLFILFTSTDPEITLK